MKKTILTSLVPAVILSLALVSGAYAQVALNKYVISGAGGSSTSADYALNGTLGLPVAGRSSSADYALQTGFWFSQTSTPLAVSTLDNAKSLANGAYVQVTGKIATTDYSNFSGFFYIEEPERSSGIRVVATSMSGTLAKGMTISVTGYTDTTNAGEREIDNATVTVSGTPALLGALGVTNKSLGGGNLDIPHRAWASTAFRAARAAITWDSSLRCGATLRPPGPVISS